MRTFTRGFTYNVKKASEQEDQDDQEGHQQVAAARKHHATAQACALHAAFACALRDNHIAGKVSPSLSSPSFLSLSSLRLFLLYFLISIILYTTNFGQAENLLHRIS